MRKHKKRVADQTLLSLVTFETHPDQLKAIIDTRHAKQKPDTLGLTFVSPEHVLDFMLALLEHAALVWPDHPLIKMYREQ